MKKDEVVEKIDQAGTEINDLYVRAWDTALHPTERGWVPSILSIASIPVLSAATIGQMVSSAVVRQISPNVFDKLSDLGGKKPDK